MTASEIAARLHSARKINLRPEESSVEVLLRQTGTKPLCPQSVYAYVRKIEQAGSPRAIARFLALLTRRFEMTSDIVGIINFLCTMGLVVCSLTWMIIVLNDIVEHTRGAVKNLVEVWTELQTLTHAFIVTFLSAWVTSLGFRLDRIRVVRREILTLQDYEMKFGAVPPEIAVTIRELELHAPGVRQSMCVLHFKELKKEDPFLGLDDPMMGVRYWLEAWDAPGYDTVRVPHFGVYAACRKHIPIVRTKKVPPR